jgi:hypothetical protein
MSGKVSEGTLIPASDPDIFAIRSGSYVKISIELEGE